MAKATRLKYGEVASAIGALANDFAETKQASLDDAKSSILKATGKECADFTVKSLAKSAGITIKRRQNAGFYRSIGKYNCVLARALRELMWNSDMEIPAELDALCSADSERVEPNGNPR